MTSTALAYEIREYRPDDEAAVLLLLRTALGWKDDERFTALFRWKHLDGPWGPSPAWVAVADHEIVGYRAFMRWRFLLDGQRIDAVRAVDTATHSDFRGQGIFRNLTMHGVEGVREQGVGFVFNTPNDQSRPGYLKMGWRTLGHLPVAITAPRRLSSIRRTLAARTSASLWSLACNAGVPAKDLLRDRAPDLAAMITANVGLTTERSADYLRWRYGSAPLGYRAVISGDRTDGAVFLRLRRRGSATEGVVGDIVVPGGDRAAARRLLAAARRATSADYLIALRTAPALPRGLVPLPAQGPLLTWRDLVADEPPPFDRWHLSLGDIELF